MKNLRVPQVKDSILCPTPTLTELDQLWYDYVNASNDLTEMKHPNSKAVNQDIEEQVRLTEKLLQDWINGTKNFKAQLK